MYLRVDENKYPYWDADLRKDNPNTSFPVNALSNANIRSDYGIAEVQSVEPPAHKPGWKITEAAPQLDGSTWTQVWAQTLKDIGELEGDDVQEVSIPAEEGFTRMLSDTPVLDGDVWKQDWSQVPNTWWENRKFAYGDVDKQIEFITENGLEAWQAKVAEIKAKYPKG